MFAWIVFHEWLYLYHPMTQSRAIEMHCAWINFQEEDAKSRNQQILFTRNPIHRRMFGEQMQQMKEKYLFL